MRPLLLTLHPLDLALLQVCYLRTHLNLIQWLISLTTPTNTPLRQEINVHQMLLLTAPTQLLRCPTSTFRTPELALLPIRTSLMIFLDLSLAQLPSFFFPKLSN